MRVERRQSFFIREMTGYNEGGGFRGIDRGRLNVSVHIERGIPKIYREAIADCRSISSERSHTIDLVVSANQVRVSS